MKFDLPSSIKDKIKKDFDLSKLTWFQTGGKADYFYQVQDTRQHLEMDCQDSKQGQGEQEGSEEVYQGGTLEEGQAGAGRDGLLDFSQFRQVTDQVL